MVSRRMFNRSLFQTGVAAASAPLWNHFSANAFAQSPFANSYKAVVLVTMIGGNDGNNMLVPMDSVEYGQYSALRSAVAIPLQQLNLLSGQTNGKTYGLHPSLVNVSNLYNRGKALAVANVGPLAAPATKAQILNRPMLAPEALLSHPAGQAQWESASTVALPATGWGGRLADFLSDQSGQLPPVLNAGSPASIFSVGRSVQGIVLQTSDGGSFTPLPTGIDTAILQMANNDALSSNQIVSQAAKLRASAMVQQQLLIQAQTSGAALRTVFPQTVFGNQLKAIAQVINGRSVVGGSRQIFYCQQGLYDCHVDQLSVHANQLTEFDNGIEAFFNVLEELGLANQVLVCTHSDFNRTLVANSSGGTDHAWGNHQLILGGGISGGRIVGSVPEPELGGSADLNGYGTWIPTLSATQMTAGIGSWMGLSAEQLRSIFPDLINFTNGAIAL